MRSLALILLLTANSYLAHADSTVPTKLEGEIKNAFCGNIYDLSSEKNKKSDSCIIWVQLKSGKKFGVFSSNNAYLPFLEDGNDAKALIGQYVKMNSCDSLPTTYYPKAFFEALSVMNVDKSYTYIACYPSDISLVPLEKDLLSPQKIAGTYMGKSKLSNKTIKVLVTTEINEESEPDLFNKKNFNIYIQYFNDGKVVDGMAAADLSLNSTDLNFAMSSSTNYYYNSFSQDCDDPDCYNTDGELKFIRNKNSNYTLSLQFEYYNAHPNEYGDENDFSEEVFLKKIQY